MSEEYTPTTEEVCRLFSENEDGCGCEKPDLHSAQFHRWLTSHDLELREQIEAEIMALRWEFSLTDELLEKFGISVRDRCAEIARGKK